VASDFVRQISSPFTTRLALVFASCADENIIRIETVQDAFVAFFLLVDFEKTSQQLLKVPKAPRSALKVRLGNLREQSNGRTQLPASLTRRFHYPREIFPSMY
jgi:hypothetical protein